MVKTRKHAPDYLGMKKMLDYLKVSYWLVGLDLVLLDVNQTFLDMTGARAEKLIGRNLLTLVRPKEATRIKDAVQNLDRKDTPIQFEFYVYGRKNRAKIPVLFHLTVNRDPGGQPVSFNMLLSDMTPQKTLEEKERELFHARRKIRNDALKRRMIGSGKAMEKVYDNILRCAEVDSPVFITGETGVGKEVVAREIHAHSYRSKKPFVAVNCGALPESLLESELFGHVKGAFTGAVSNRPGLFREAEGGTLFLDEIGDMERRLQVKLLRAIQEKEIRPVGDDKNYPMDLRIICATHQDLLALAESGGFRQDLYYRISVVPIHIPPLRQRPEDIIKLAEHFIQLHPKNKRFTAISEDARKLLYNYHWPGNIRELQNTIEYALVMHQKKTLEAASLPDSICRQGLRSKSRNQNNPSPPMGQMENVKNEAEKQTIIKTIEKYNGNQTLAAEKLGISRVTLWRKRCRYNIH